MPKNDKNGAVKTGAVKGNQPTAKMKSHLNIGVLSIMTLICGAVIANLFKVSIMEHGKYEKLANNYHFDKITLEAQRGAIYDATGTPLAWSATVYNVYIDPTLFREEMKEIEEANESKRSNAQKKEKQQIIL